MTQTTQQSVTVVITTAVELTSKQLSAIKKTIEAKHGKNVEYQEVLDPSVIGGIKIRVGSVEYNATVAAKFDSLRSQLAAKV